MKRDVRVTVSRTTAPIGHEMLLQPFNVDRAPKMFSAIAHMDYVPAPARLIAAIRQVGLMKSIYEYGISPSNSP